MNVLVDISDRKRAEEAQALLGGDRRVVGRRDRQQDARRHHPVLERRRRAAVRLHGRGGRRPVRSRCSFRPSGTTRSDDPRAAPPRRADRALRDGRASQGRPPDRRFADHLARSRQHGPDRRRLEDRPRHHRPQAAPKSGLPADERPAEADRRKDEFLAMLAHELRNPLAPIRNALHILRAAGRRRPGRRARRAR